MVDIHFKYYDCKNNIPALWEENILCYSYDHVHAFVGD